MTPAPCIRVKARAIIRRGDEVLLSFAIDPASGARYGRLLGGSVELGERAEHAVRRELREEIGVELGRVELRGVVENVFTWGEQVVHEVLFVFVATLDDPAVYARDSFVVNEAVCDGPAVWVPLDRLLRRDIALYPPDLVDLIAEDSSRLA